MLNSKVCVTTNGVALCEGAENTLPRSDSDDGELPSEFAGATFAPDDAEELDHQTCKDNVFGLGYKPLCRDNILGRNRRDDWMQPGAFTIDDKTKNKKMSIKGQAFGVGAFEEEDEDIYGHDDMSHYDFVLGGPPNQNPKSVERKSKPTSHPGISLSEVTELLEGFVLSSNPLIVKHKHPLPELPCDFAPSHKPRRKRFTGRDFEQSGLGRHDLTSKDRQRILEGSATQNVVEVRIGVKGQPPPPMQPEQLIKVEQSDMEEQSIEDIVSETTSSPLPTNYKPFAKDEAKQKRYELFIRMKEKGIKNRFKEVQPSSFTEWEREREVEEFNRASQLYKPLNMTMSTRFVTSSLEEGTPLLKDGLNMNIKKLTSSFASKFQSSTLTNILEETSNSEGLQEVKPAVVLPGGVSAVTGPALPASDDPRVNAARAGMFGKLTLKVLEWHPDNLLCRRFNVPNPYPE